MVSMGYLMPTAKSNRHIKDIFWYDDEVLKRRSDWLMTIQLNYDVYWYEPVLWYQIKVLIDSPQNNVNKGFAQSNYLSKWWFL